MGCDAKTRSGNMVLVGFMGTGKTTVGALLAERLGWRFVDLDEAIEQRVGMSIPELFESQGEAAFRSLESEMVGELAAQAGWVISCGGGIVKNPNNIAVLEASGSMVCLTAEAETILERVGDDTHRPLLAGADRLQRIRDLLAERAAMYEQFERQVPTDGLQPDEIVDAVIAVVSP